MGARPSSTLLEAHAGPRPAGDLVSGRFRVEKRLGAGGMGSVYRVVDQSTGKALALKELGGRSAIRESKEAAQRLRFRREFHTMALLRHPRIVEVYDYGIDDDTPYYTMEILDGQDLRDLGTVPFPRACRLLRDVASALAFLHARRLIHRDIAPRNVRCTTDDRAKIIDFGVIATPGICGDIAGTPRFISPENVRGLPLDHRADLFGLGALAYWLCTGADAYSAQHIEDLEAAWAVTPRAPSTRVAEIPAALDDLILSLLSLDPLGRPATAAEVIDRLGAIAGLEPAPETEAARGYLASTAMVGRHRELGVLRRKLGKALEGEGGSAVIEAPSGTGKSRLLREVGLEAQVAGATVITADSESAGKGPYGLLAALGSALLAAAPREAQAALKARAPYLARVLPDLRARLGAFALAPQLGDPSEDRARTQKELAGWVLDVAAQRPLVLLVDDVQRSDEASAAVLASLAHAAAGYPMLVTLGLRTDEPMRAPAAIAAMRDAGIRIRIGGLKPKDIEELFRSMFGDVPHLARMSLWMQKIAGSSPLHCIELARHLVDEGIIRYVDGVWSVPEEPRLEGMPKGLAEAMEARVFSLTPRARALAEALSVHGGELTLYVCMLLADGMTAVKRQDAAEKEVFAALDELLYEEILIGSESRYRFRHDGFREALLRNLDEERRRGLHLRVGEALATSGEVGPEREAEVGWHLLRGGETRRGSTFLARAGTRLYEAQSFADAVAPLEAALKVYESEARAPRDVLALRHMLIMVGAMSDRLAVLRYADDTIATLGTYSGMDRAARLSRVVGRLLGLVLGIALAWVAWVFTRPRRRGPSPSVAIQSFYVEIAYAAATFSLSFEVDRVRALVTRLAPLTVFTNRMPRGAYLLTENLLGMPLGRWGMIRRNATEILRILQVDHLTPLTEFDRKNAEGAARYMRAMAGCLSQEPSCLEEIARLQALNLRYFDVCANTCLIAYHRLRGEEEIALDVERKNEVLLVQLGSMWGPEASVQYLSGLAYGLTRDVLGLRRSMEELNRLTREGYRLEPYLELARGEYLRERGELDTSRIALEKSLSMLPADEAFIRPAVLSALAETLLASRDLDRAREVAQAAVTFGEDPEVYERTWRLRAARVMALIEAASGDTASAMRRLDTAIDEASHVKSPTMCGALHEARARLALAMGHDADYALHRHAAESWFRATRNPALIARIARLPELTAAANGPSATPHDASSSTSRPSERTIVASPSARGDVIGDVSVITDEAVTQAREDDASWVSGILRGCRGPAERAARALDLLTVAAAGTGGYLYLVREGGLQLVAPLYGDEPSDALVASLRRMVTDAARGESYPPPSDGLLERASRRLLLTIERKGRRTIVGAAAIFGGAATSPAARLVQQVARELHDAGDVSAGSLSDL